jgi:hypothetical protein
MKTSNLMFLSLFIDIVEYVVCQIRVEEMVSTGFIWFRVEISGGFF